MADLIIDFVLEVVIYAVLILAMMLITLYSLKWYDAL